MSAVTLDHIKQTRQTIRDSVRHTPLVPSQTLSGIAGVPVHLKLETLQDIGAFKIRGATNKLASLTEDEKSCGVVAVSTGNHGRGVVVAAGKMGIRAIICMSNLVPENKLAGIRALGAEVRIIGKSQDDAGVEARRLTDDEGMINAHPFDDVHVIAGQGTVGLELLEDLPDLKTAIIPLSGGGLAGGIALALKSANPEIRVVGVSMKKGAAMIQSIHAGKLVPVEELPTLADSLGGDIGLENSHTFQLCRDHIDDLITVTEDQIAAAMAHFYWEERIIVEGGGSVGAAVILNGLVPDLQGPVAVVVSGRNVGMAKLHQITENHPPAGQGSTYD